MSTRSGAALVFLVGCATGVGGAADDVDPAGTLVVTPGTATLDVVNGVTARQAFTALHVDEDGATSDVTSDVTWSVTPGFGGFTGPTFATIGDRAGVAIVHARLASLVGEARIEVNVRGVRLGAGAPADAPDLFAGGVDDPASGPAIVYPPDQVIVPPNLGDLEAHWTDGFGHDLYELRLYGDHVDLRVYVGAGATGWSSFTSREWSVAARSTPELTLGLRGLATAAPSTIGVAPKRSITTTDDDVAGGIYYWASRSATGAYGIFRRDFGQPAQLAEEFFTSTQTGRCVACHALSRDGTRMAVSYDAGDRSSTIVAVGRRVATIPDETVFWNFATFSPDGTRLITARGGVLTIRDGETGVALDTVTTGDYATQPDFSPDGTALVYVAVAAPIRDWQFEGGTIEVIPYDAGTGRFGAPRPLVTDGGNNYFPSFSPDGQWILFNRSVEDAYDDGSAELWVVKADGSAAPRRLDLANLGPGLTNSWARWAPFRNSHGTEGLYWLTFSSKRAFGVRLPGGQPQLWMAPFFPGRAAAGGDPSAPAFRLPFQDLGSNNHNAQWTETVVPIERVWVTAVQR